MSHDNMKEVEVYMETTKKCKNHMTKELLRIFELDDMLDAVIWQLYVNSIDDENVLREDRKEYIQNIVNKMIDKWVG